MDTFVLTPERILDYYPGGNDCGSKLTKTWRDVKKFQMKFMPMKFIVKRSAKQESAKLRKAWDKAAGITA